MSNRNLEVQCRTRYPPAAWSPPSPTGATDYPSLIEQAVEAYAARDANRAIELFGQIVERTPQRADGWYGLSRALEWADQLEQAIVAGERAQELGWIGGGPAYRLARLHALVGDTDGALGWLDQALAERFEERPTIAGDEAFASMRDNPRFRRIAGLPDERDTSRDARWRFDLAYLIEPAHARRPAAARFRRAVLGGCRRTA